MVKKILHLCADIGSDSRYFYLDPEYEVIKIGREIGVENYHPPENIYGIIANPPCTEFSMVSGIKKNTKKGMFLVDHCIRIIKECNPHFWIIENPAAGRLKEFLGKPKFIYQPWQYGSPWTKKTALWGNFKIPPPDYHKWNDVPKLNLYTRPGREKPSLAFLHHQQKIKIPEWEWAYPLIKTDMDFRSMCSDGFSKKFYEYNN